MFAVFLMRFQLIYRVISTDLSASDVIVFSVSLAVPTWHRCILMIQMRQVLINCFFLRAISNGIGVDILFIPI